MNDLSERIDHALADVPEVKAADARDALSSYLADPDPVGALILLNAMTAAVGPDRAYAALDFLPPTPGLVYCCPTMGWVTREQAADHSYDSSFGWD